MKDKASAPASLNNNLAISPERRFTVEEVAKAIAAEAIGKGGYRGSEAEAQFAVYVKNILAKTDFVALEEVAQGIERVQEQVNHNMYDFQGCLALRVFRRSNKRFIFSTPARTLELWALYPLPLQPWPQPARRPPRTRTRTKAARP
jgi:hypothetical protein